MKAHGAWKAFRQASQRWLELSGISERQASVSARRTCGMWLSLWRQKSAAQTKTEGTMQRLAGVLNARKLRSSLSNWQSAMNMVRRDCRLLQKASCHVTRVTVAKALAQWQTAVVVAHRSAMGIKRAISARAERLRSGHTLSSLGEDVRDMWHMWRSAAQRRIRANSKAVNERWALACLGREEARRQRCFRLWTNLSRQKEASKAMMRRAALLGFLPEKRKPPPPRP